MSPQFTEQLAESATSRPFSAMARVYDAIMDDIAYEAWVAFILESVGARGWQGQHVLDLGCGTGNSMFPFFSRGFTVTGIDASPQMLAVAKEKLPPVRLLQADFETFEVDEQFDLVVSVFDSLNNLLDPAAFSRMARQVLKHLTKGGYFMFDVNTTVGLKDLWESDRAEGWAGEVYYRWEHSFDEATGLARVTAHCAKGTLEFTEIHYERPYDPDELRTLLTKAGFVDVEVITLPDGQAATSDDERVWALARRA